MLVDDAAWRAWGALLGCQCADCEEQARRFVCLCLDKDLKIVSSGSVSEDGKRFGAVGAHGETILHIVDQKAFEVLHPHLHGALSGHGWGGAFNFRGHDCTEMIVKITALPLFGAESVPVGVQLTLEDKTRSYARKAMHTELRDRLSIIQQNAADGILSMDEHGVIESVNRAAELMFGWRAAELVGRPVSLLMPQPIADMHQTYVERYFATGESGILNVGPRTLSAQRKDGSIIQIEISISEASVDKRSVFIGVCRDVAKRSELTGSTPARSEAEHADFCICDSGTVDLGPSNSLGQ